MKQFGVFALCAVLAVCAMAPFVSEAGGRWERKVCWDGGCAVRPDPKVNKDAQYVTDALNAVFSSEIASTPGLSAYLQKATAGMPRDKAWKDLRALQQTNPSAASVELEAVIRAAKDAYVRETGIGAYIDATAHPPVVTSFSPASGVSGDTLTITGSGLGHVEFVLFEPHLANGIIAYVERPTDTSITVTVPKYLKGGTVTLAVQTKFGTKVSFPGTFTVLDGTCTDTRISAAYMQVYNRPARGTGTGGECNPLNYATYATTEELVAQLASRGAAVAPRNPPIITAISGSGRAQPGETVTIHGIDLVPVKEVRFGAASATFASLDPYTLTAVVPQGGSLGKIAVTTYSGTAETAFEFEVTTPPTITSVTPSSLLRGTPIFVQGTNFATDATATLDGTISLRVESRTPTELRIATDNVTNSPNATLAISGSGGGTETTVSVWGGLCADPLLTGVFQDLYARSPLGYGTEGECDPSLYTVASWSSASSVATGVKAVKGPPSPARVPTITAVTPSSGLPGGLVNITGTNLFSSGITVEFGGVPSRELVSLGTNTLQARIPEHAGEGVTVTTYTGSASAAFGLTEPMTLRDVSPKTGMAGSSIVITGTGLDGVTVTIDGIAAEGGGNANRVWAKIPSGANGYADITLTRPDGISITWPNYAVYTVNLRLPEGSERMHDALVELVGPDGKVIGTSFLIGNAGAGLTDEEITNLIGNAGAGLIGNAGAGLIGNAGASLSLEQLGKLIGNAGASFNGGSIANLIGNAGASLKFDLTNLAGNAGSTLAGNAGSTLAGNAGSTLAGNFGSGLAGNNGSGLVMSFDYGFADASMLSYGGASELAGRSVMSLGSRNEIVPASDTFSPAVAEALEAAEEDAAHIAEEAAEVEEEIAEMADEIAQEAKDEDVEDEEEDAPEEPEEADDPEEEEEEEDAVEESEPAEEETDTQVEEESEEADDPEEEPAEVPEEEEGEEEVGEEEVSTDCPDGYTYSPTLGQCMEDEEEEEATSTDCPDGFTYSPTLAQCIEDDPAEDSPYAGQPCNEYIPLYQQPGCIQE